MFVVYLWDICFRVGSFYFASVIVFYCLNIFRSNTVTLGNGHNYTYRCSLSGYTEGSQFSKCCAISATFLRFACLQIFPLLLYWAHWKSTSNFPFCFCLLKTSRLVNKDRNKRQQLPPTIFHPFQPGLMLVENVDHPIRREQFFSRNRAWEKSNQPNAVDPNTTQYVPSQKHFVLGNRNKDTFLFAIYKFRSSGHVFLNERIFSYQVCMLALKIYKIHRRNCEILPSSACVNDTGLNTVSRKQLLLDHICNYC